MTGVTLADITAAQARIGNRVRRTPVIRLEADQLGTSHPGFWLKLESMQATGAFKARGALNSMLAVGIPAAGVCAASGGNHGQGVAWAARMLGVSATVFVPTTCPEIKLRRMRGFGADVAVTGAVYDDSYAAAERFVERTGAVLIHPFDRPSTVAGAGTVTAEFMSQVPVLDTVLVPVGGGGLLAGAIAALADTDAQVVAVEPTTARCLGAALQAGRPVDVDVSGPAVDSLGPRRIGQLGFDAARANAIRQVEVSNEAITRAQLTAWNELRVGLEGGGAAALAAVLEGAYVPAEDETVGILSCGGNVDIATVLRGMDPSGQGAHADAA